MVWFLCFCGRIFCARKQGRRSNFLGGCATLVAPFVAFDTLDGSMIFSLHTSKMVLKNDNIGK